MRVYQYMYGCTVCMYLPPIPDAMNSVMRHVEFSECWKAQELDIQNLQQIMAEDELYGMGGGREEGYY